jgi:hypothetical protein
MSSKPLGFGGALILALLLSSSSVCAQTQQLQGRFYGETDSYMVGEPVLFNLEIKNTGPEVLYLHAKNPAGCLDTYEFSAQGTNSPVCSAKWNSECIDDLLTLKPGESEQGQWPLNFWYQFEKEGKYEVNVTRHIPIMSSAGEYRDFTFSSKFEVRIAPLDSARVQGILQDFEKKLHSHDPEVRHAALDVLSSTAPEYFQDIALTVSRSKDAFAVLHAIGALERINSAETRAALGDLLTAEEPSTDDEILVRVHAIEGLGHSGDASYQTSIGRYLEDKNEHIQLAAMVAIAQLGKADAVPQLQHFFFSSNPLFRKNAAYALSYSTRPEAVEALIDAIPDKDSGVRERILASLTSLTGHPFEDAKGTEKSPVQTQNAWRFWWRENKDKVYFPDRLEFLCRMK